MVVRPARTALRQLLEEAVCNHFIEGKCAEEITHLALGDAAIVIAINDAKCFAHVGESLGRFFPHLLQNLVELICNLCTLQIHCSSIQRCSRTTWS